ncbi:MAG: deoxyribodipyrimidine photo-lyase [Pseudomonadota bacterium]|nr:MAG: deoxyribodipyrimidine photo-lyase [Pseudomonadota bacterium]
MTTAIVWFRRDLRLADNAALAQALAVADCVLPIYIHAPEEDGDWAPGAASNWWLHHSLAALSESLARRGGRLLIRRGPSLATLRELIRATGAAVVCFNRLYDPARRASDRLIEQTLTGEGVDVQTTSGHLLVEPWSITSQSGSPYRIYTPFFRQARTRITVSAPSPVPRKLAPPPTRIETLALDELDLLPRIRWDTGLAKTWQPGERGANKRLRALAEKLAAYSKERDMPARDSTLRISPHLHFGEITPRQAWYAIQQSRAAVRPGLIRGAEILERELLWREFAHHVLHHFPHTPNAPLDERFNNFPWRRSKTLLSAWQRAETGIPIVDAGMRELWATGFMHNRVRMITASFLTKHMRLDWRSGARWFWDTLVDADLANNTLNWQWVAGCGADAAPYFRIFNPVLQSRKFDPHGDYLVTWLPALNCLPPKYRHAPWEAPPAVRETAGFQLGKDYPPPILDLAAERNAALAAFRRSRGLSK